MSYRPGHIFTTGAKAREYLAADFNFVEGTTTVLATAALNSTKFTYAGYRFMIGCITTTVPANTGTISLGFFLSDSDNNVIGALSPGTNIPIISGLTWNPAAQASLTWSIDLWSGTGIYQTVGLPSDTSGNTNKVVFAGHAMAFWSLTNNLNQTITIQAPTRTLFLA